ncbi:hypothetical protein VCHC46B1_2153 [Vibrio cholerae HC-46B1]|nr:hypothetical protein VCHE48_0977 [Vibrio cholerae HE48]EJH52975.1 hypothetical protein VCHC43B1_2232 [Vibrio cholerae HC-43B1]EKL03657.1 hypothetical protein VCHC41B1_1204 [Vibrio cholerae HC-41B1]EKL97212.1 hypothetical protein VCHC46B1_2153 [Vibrio cholerae HC-46B1]EKM04890.1 hypothetical protein VCHC44C1_1194 [Vibrio cholerae HC-44C1]CFW04837.1 hypothetical protein [Vibrio cholerae]
MNGKSFFRKQLLLENNLLETITTAKSGGLGMTVKRGVVFTTPLLESI